MELKPPSPDNFAEATGFFERALALDPTSVEAASYLAGTLAGRVLDGMTSSSEEPMWSPTISRRPSVLATAIIAATAVPGLPSPALL